MIIPVEEKHIEKIVDLHYKVLYWSMNSQLGRGHLENLYNSLIKDDKTFGFVYFSRDKLIGFITLTTDYEHTRKVIFSNYNLKKYLQLIWVCIKKPLNFVDIFENMFLIPGLLKNIKTNTEIITWVTDLEDFKSPVAAVKTMQAARNFLKDKGIMSSFAQVAKYDSKPNNFHKSAKNKLVKSYIRNNIYQINSN